MKKISAILMLITAFNISYAQNNIFPATGNVGIGTTNPTRLLDISSGAGVGPLKVTGPNGSLLIDNVGSGESYYQASRFHQFQGSSAPIMTLPSSGNVGIGTVNPSSKLTVSGNIEAREVKVAVTAGAAIYFKAN